MRLRPVRETDLDALEAEATEERDPWNYFEPGPRDRLRRRFEETGCLEEHRGTLVIETAEGELAGSVSWHPVQHGPSETCRALNIGISVFVAFRGQGIGSQAQRRLADHLFATRSEERIEAGTDVENVAEQRALEKAGFSREGVMRHAQFRAGEWRDVVMYSRLRSDPD